MPAIVGRRLSSDVVYCKAGKFGDLWIDRNAGIFTPNPWQSNLYNPTTIIEPEPLHSEFDDAIGIAIEPGCLHVDHNAYPGRGLRICHMKMSYRDKATLHAIVRMLAQKFSGLLMSIGHRAIHLREPPVMSPPPP